LRFCGTLVSRKEVAPYPPGTCPSFRGSERRSRGGVRIGCVRGGRDLDSSFSGDGKVSTTFGKWESYATAVAVQPDGKIVVGFSSGDFAVGRYNADGTLDATFSENGKVLTWDGKGGRVQARARALQPDGRIVVVGETGGKVAIARCLG
jgi:uncharacterized delta-60 repeat protein